ncbi:hypothetical protein MKW94_018705 [Papaver nudicaule]|uniref:Glycoside hydrolase family 5 domain-containing protein n=1 Tax=Papaver nudicaule TaxID=74823 RepID=A0AA41VJX7_PAPNU|nr:hypothetical protein [Papaver nudicaule]
MVMKTVLLACFFFFVSVSYSLPLSTNGRWVVDTPTGDRVKLRCVNWASHMQTLLAEGLDKQPLHGIVNSMSSLGFNCVRLTWATYMFTKPSNGNLTVDQSFEKLGLLEAKAGIAKNNPGVLNMTVLEAYDAVVDELGKQGIMVVLDNHVTMPQWCCGDGDGNGFFGDKFFDPNEWQQGLSIVANRFKGKPQVVGMSMRNELRGPRQNKQDWYRYVRLGGETIHKLNPKLLVIISGLGYDTDLSFLKNETLNSNFDNKLVYEGHWYAFSGGRREDWVHKTPDQICAITMKEFDDKLDFVTSAQNPIPLFLSEFGVDQRGVNDGDNRFLSCFLGYAARRDLDWAMWAMQGSYYVKNGVANFDETYGVLDNNWSQPRNPKFRERYRLIQDMLQDPRSKLPTDHIIYHPLSGLCLFVDKNSNIQASDCLNRSHWSYAGNQAPLKLAGTSKCLKVNGNGLPVTVSNDCSSDQSAWKVILESNMRLAAMDQQGRSLCLDYDTSKSPLILSNECQCVTDDASKCKDNPETQWFKLIQTNAKQQG